MRVKLLGLVAMLSQRINRVAAEGGGTAVALGNAEEVPSEALVKENKALRTKNEALRTKISELEKRDTPDVQKKMEAGLTREQAESAVKHQAAFSSRFKMVFPDGKRATG